jgi:ABC-2 type transport system ATP-binding protein
MEAIKICELSKRYGGKTVLESVSTEVASGKVVGLLGRNGAGKTTLLSLLSGLEKPESGNAAILGIDSEVDPEALRQQSVLVTEECHFYGWMTPERLAKTFSTAYKSWSQQQYETLLKQFKIEKNQKISTFSKGTKRKLQLAFAMATQPKVLLLDEPIGGIDIVAREEIIGSLIQSLVDQGVTIVISSHEIRDIAGVCDKVLILSQGKFVVDSEKDELLAKVRRLRVQLENPVETLPSHPAIMAAKASGSELELLINDFNEETIENMLSNFKVKNTSVEGVSLHELFFAMTAGEEG